MASPNEMDETVLEARFGVVKDLCETFRGIRMPGLPAPGIPTVSERPEARFCRCGRRLGPKSVNPGLI